MNRAQGGTHSPTGGLLGLAESAWQFVKRHRWSLPLASLASVSFAQLGSEMREGEVAAFDAAVFEVVEGWRGHLDAPLLFLTQIGGVTGMAAVTAACVVVLLLVRRRREAAFLLIAAGGALLINTLLKLIFHRARPQALEYLINLPPSFSFPSGHAMASMAVFTSLLVVLHTLNAPRWAQYAALVLTAVIAPGVALSRVYFGVHYPSDVIGGQLAAAAWVSAITGWFHPHLLPGEHAATAVDKGDAATDS